MDESALRNDAVPQLGIAIGEKDHQELVDVLRCVAKLMTLSAVDAESARDIALAAAALKRTVIRLDRRSSSHRAVALTPRERQIVRLLAQSKSYKEIAIELDLAVSTAQSRVKNIYAKLGVHSKQELVDALPGIST